MIEMPVFIKSSDVQLEGIKPFDAFPVEFSEGSMSALLFGDELSEALLIYTLLSSTSPDKAVYNIGPAGLVPPKGPLSNVENLYLSRVYSLDEMASALNLVRETSTVVVSRFSALLNRSAEGLVKVRRIADDRGLILIITHETLEMNELNLPTEFTEHFLLPELFDSLLVLRTNSYRGHYRLNLTVLKAPLYAVSVLGDHSIPVDSIVKPLLGLSHE